MKTTTIYRFGEFEVDLGSRELRREGDAKATRPKVFALLAYLLEQHQRAVGREELLTKLWGGTAVSDAVLTTVIKEARQLVGDTGGRQRVIRTIHGHGYQFVADLVPLANEAAVPPVEVAAPATASDGEQPASRAGQLSPQTNRAGALPQGGEYKIACVVSVGVGPRERLEATLGTEALHALKQDVQRTIAQVATTLGGHLLHGASELEAQAVFGAPIAREDYTLRGVSAALELRRRLDALLQAGASAPTDSSKGASTAATEVRIGVHAGTLLVSPGAGLGPGQLMMTSVDDALQLADALQHAGDPGQIALSDALRQQLGAQVDTRAVVVGKLGSHHELVALNTSQAPASGTVAAARGEHPFVGRETDLDRLERLWTSARDGRGQVVGLQGEPGMGKSRLAREFLARRRRASHQVLLVHCSSIGQPTPFAPLANLLRHQCGLTPTDSVERVRDGLGQWLASLQLPARSAAALGSLLGDTPPDAELSEMSPPARKALIFEALIELLLRLSPALLVVEDAHWIDAASDEWLATLVERLARAPLMVLVSYRPEYRPSWIHKSYATQHALLPLASDSSRELFDYAAGSDALPDALPDATVASMLAKADGNPLFIEQLARMAAVEPSGAPLPDSLRTMLSARIDRLPNQAKALLQTTSVVGSTAPLKLIGALLDWTPQQLETALQQLGSEELLHTGEGELGPSALFNHALIQEAAYSSLGQFGRRELHRRIAALLERDFKQASEQRPELLAQHYAAGEQYEQAIEHWQRAGALANAKSANREAIGHIEQAMPLLQHVADPTARGRFEAGLQLVVVAALIPTQGYAAPAVRDACERALQLSEADLESPLLPAVYRGLTSSYFLRGQLEEAARFGRRLLKLVTDRDEAHEVEACAVLAMILSHRGLMVDAVSYFERGIASYDPILHHRLTFGAGQDPGVLCMSFGALARHWCGSFSKAQELVEGALALSNRLAHPFTEALAHYARAGAALLFGDIDQCRLHATRSVELSSHYGFPHWLGASSVLRGWAMARSGDPAGIDEMRKGLALQHRAGTRAAQTYLAAHLADGLLHHQDVDAGLETIDGSFDILRETGERFWEPELHRLRGELLLLDGKRHDREQALSSMQAAWRSACELDATAWKLCVALSLARHAPTKDNLHQLRQSMAAIVGGELSRDYRDAQSLLQSHGG